MSGPARAGLFVYAKDTERVSRFYEAVAGMCRLHQSDELIALGCADIQLLVHKIPAQFENTITITTPPKRREQTALKFFFTVPSLAATRGIVSSHGGEVFEERWDGPGFVACNAMDPEGNVFQLRETVT